MGKLILSAAVVCLIFFHGMDAKGQTVVQDHFVGASFGVTNGAGGGIIGMNQLCKLSFGSTAHMCTWDEFYHSAGNLLRTPAAPLPPLPNGALGLWASASWHNCIVSSTLLCQKSGTDSWVNPPALAAASCSNWSSNTSASGSAVIIQTFGVPVQTFGFVPCGTTMPVACCAP